MNSLSIIFLKINATEAILYSHLSTLLKCNQISFSNHQHIEKENKWM